MRTAHIRSKNKTQQAQGLLAPKANGNDYADARTKLALEQAKRITQIRRKAEGELIEAAEVRDLLVTCCNTFRAALQAISPRFRARFPRLPEEAHDFIKKEHEDALRTLAEALRRMAKGSDEQGAQR